MLLLIAAWMLAADKGPPWEVIVPGGVTLLIALMAYFRPTKDAEARQRSSDALAASEINAQQVATALAMEKASRERADHLEQRLDDVETELRECRHDCARCLAELEQHKAEAAGLAAIVDERVLGNGGDVET